MLDVCLLGCAGMMPLPYRWLTSCMMRIGGSTILIDCGSLTRCIEGATKRLPDAVIGKPNPIMLYTLRDSLGLKSDEIAMVGDRIYTDVAAGLNAGNLGVLVLSGETTLEVAEASDVNPDIIALNILEFGKLLYKSRGYKY